MNLPAFARDYPLLRGRRAGRGPLKSNLESQVPNIGASVGYPDAFYFSRQFRTVHGCSPSEYRRGHEDPRPP